jgi:hypothetical protein
MKPAFFVCLFSFLARTALAEDGWVSLFNGKDLGNWVNVNCAPETWGVGDGVITCTGKPTGALRTKRMYENFEFEVEWRHLKSGGNAGIFIWAGPMPAVGQPFLRAIEVQVLDNGYAAKGRNENFTTHGDMFPIHGSTMKPIHRGRGMRCFPIEERSKSAPEWNHYRIVANNGSLRLSVNGKEVSGGDDCHWRNGYLALESEGSPTEWRNLRLRELPSTGATPEETAPEDDGWTTLYSGVDLRGWKQEPVSMRPNWSADDWKLVSPGKGDSAPDVPIIWHDVPAGDIELIFDWRFPNGEAAKSAAARVLIGTEAVPIPLQAAADSAQAGAMKPPGQWNRGRITRKGELVSFAVNDSEVPPGTGRREGGLGAQTRIGLLNPGGVIEMASLFVRAKK